jgi:AraC-like DNA-binding protein
MSRLALGWLPVIALLGAIQGVFLAMALAAKRRNRTANRLLAATMLAFSIYLATTVYHATGYEQVFPHFFGAAHPMPFLFGPLIYLYAVTAADRDRGLTRRDLLHFLPFAAVVVAGLPIYAMSGPEKLAFFVELRRGEVPLHIEIEIQLKLVSGIIYATATIVFLWRHSRRVKDSYSSIERVNLRWLVWLGAAAGGVWLLAVVVQILESTGAALPAVGEAAISLAIAALVYGIGYKGLRQPEIFRYETAEYQVPVELRAPTVAPAAVVPAAEPPAGAPVTVAEPGAPELVASRYERSGLSEREANQLKTALMTTMDRDRPWRDSELTLADLATLLDTTPHKLSEVLNSEIGQTFYDFVNGYRVREVQRRIAAGEARKLTMLALALDAGFASKSTFNTVFKKHTSQTPSDYRQAAGM